MNFRRRDKSCSHYKYAEANGFLGTAQSKRNSKRKETFGEKFTEILRLSSYNPDLGEKFGAKFVNNEIFAANTEILGEIFQIQPQSISRNFKQHHIQENKNIMHTPDRKWKFYYDSQGLLTLENVFRYKTGLLSWDKTTSNKKKPSPSNKYTISKGNFDIIFNFEYQQDIDPTNKESIKFTTDDQNLISSIDDEPLSNFDIFEPICGDEGEMIDFCNVLDCPIFSNQLCF